MKKNDGRRRAAGASRALPGMVSVLLAICAVPLEAWAQVAPAPSSAATPGPRDYRDRHFDYFVTGDPATARAAHTQAGFALMGGGGNVDDAFAFIARHAGGGHIVVLGAVSDDRFDPTDGRYGSGFAQRWGPVRSTETIIFHDREAAFDARVIAALRGADGIFLMGGDQSNYLRYWKGTPVQQALDDHVRAGRPIGGSSAGLAVLGRYSYGALDGGSMESKVALGDPFDPGMTLEDDFLRFPLLENVITDTHFSQRCRLGRLIAFLARLGADHPVAPLLGIGVDEKTALLIDADGIGRLAAASSGSVWLVMPQGPARGLGKGRALSVQGVRLVRMDQGSSIDLRTRAVEHPAAQTMLSIDKGRLTRESIASPIFLRAAAPPDEG
jgi:cyanophycinase